MAGNNDVLDGGLTTDGQSDGGTAAAIETGDDLPRSGSSHTGSMGVDVGALGGGAAIAGDARGDDGQAGPDRDGGSR